MPLGVEVNFDVEAKEGHEAELEAKIQSFCDERGNSPYETMGYITFGPGVFNIQGDYSGSLNEIENLKAFGRDITPLLAKPAEMEITSEGETWGEWFGTEEQIEDAKKNQAINIAHSHLKEFGITIDNINAMIAENQRPSYLITEAFDYRVYMGGFASEEEAKVFEILPDRKPSHVHENDDEMLMVYEDLSMDELLQVRNAYVHLLTSPQQDQEEQTSTAARKQR